MKPSEAISLNCRMKNIHAYDLLTNPVWHSLETVHRHLRLGDDLMKRYPATILQVMGCANPENLDLNEIRAIVTPGEHIYMVGMLPVLPNTWKLKAAIECLQMVYTQTSNIELSSGEIILELDARDAPEMLELVNLVQPGFFYSNTCLLGRYIGIRKNNKLVALAGERLKMTGFSEISAVSTHPDYTGRGYARLLTAQIANKNIDQGNIPFLHVRSANERAIKVYDSLGFTEVRKIHFNQLSYLEN